MLSPSLSGIDLVDDPTVVPEKYNPETIWEGVGILGYSFVPHYHSDHPDSEDIEKCVAFLDKHNMPYKALRDGEVIVVDGEKETFFGFE